MNDAEKTKEQLLKEIEELRVRLNEFESNSFQQQNIETNENRILLNELLRLANTHEQLLSVLEAFDQPIYVCDPQNYQILFVNPPLEKKMEQN